MLNCKHISIFGHMVLKYFKKNHLLQRKIKYSHYTAHIIDPCAIFLKDSCLGVLLGRHRAGWMKGGPRDTERAVTSICSSAWRPSHGDHFFHFVKKWGCGYVNWTSTSGIIGLIGFLAWEILNSHFSIKKTVNCWYSAMKYEMGALLYILN